MSTATNLRATSIYLQELETRRDRLSTGLFALGQVSGVTLETLKGAQEALRTVERQMEQEQDKLDAYAAAEPRGKRLSPCYCDYSFHPNGC